MIKKIIHITLIILLLVTTSGVNLNLHYSGNKLFSFSLIGEADSCCEMNCDCCDESTINYHLDDDFNASLTDIRIAQTVLDLPHVFSETISNLIIEQLRSERELLHLLKLPIQRSDSRSALQVFLI